MKTITNSIKKHATRASFLLAMCFGHLIFAQTGYFQNFNTGGVPAIFKPGNPYTLAIDNQTLQIKVSKGDFWSGVDLNFAPTLNLSTPANRKVSFRIKTDSSTRALPYELYLQFFSNTGGVFQQGGGKRSSKTIYPTSKWQTISFDFNDPSFNNVDFAAITGLQFVLQPLNNMLSGTLNIDDLAIGNNGTNPAIASPYFLGIPNQEIFINSSTQSVRILNAVDCDNLTTNLNFTAVSSNPAILPNPTFTNTPFLSNNYFNFTSGTGDSGFLLSSRFVTMNMTPANNQFGMVTVTITATAPSRIAGITSVPYRYVIQVNVKRNVAPTIGVIPLNLTLGSDKTTQLLFDKIFSGNGEVVQNMSITATSTDQAVIPNSQIVVSFNGISTTANVRVTPIQFGSLPVKTCNINFTITDNGGTVLGGSNQTIYTIPVNVFPTYFSPPSFKHIPDQIDNVTNQGTRTITITGINDGNNGARISSIVAVSGNTGILPNPTVSYTTGNDYALLSYNSVIVGITTVTVIATNFGAPAGSNGNSSFVDVFTMKAQAPPLNGYIEPFTVTTVVGPPNSADGRSSTTPGVWYVEYQGGVQTVTIDPNTGTFTNFINNKSGSNVQYFAGIWYKPAGGGNLFDFKNFPYLSVDLSTTNTLGNVAIDLWDVNNIRYGLTSSFPVTGSLTNYTFCYNDIPCLGTGQPGEDCGGNGNPKFDFSKVKAILFNFGVTPNGVGCGICAPDYTGTYTMKNLRIGNQAQNSVLCPGNTSTVTSSFPPNPYYLTTQSGPKVVTITGITAGSNPITGLNPNPVTVAVSGGLGANLISFNPVSGVALIGYTTPNTATTANINVNISAFGSSSSTRNFSVTVQTLPVATTNVFVNNNLTATMPDGIKGQTIDGSPFGVCEIFGVNAANFSDEYYRKLTEANVQSMRIGIWDFEHVNDNSNPNVLDKSKLDYDAMQIEFFKKASAAGVKRFMVTFFSPPSFVKYNNDAIAGSQAGYILNNTIDSAYYKEYAEYAVAFVQGVKENAGVDIYGLSIGNEIQFNQSYQSVVYNQSQYVEVIRTIGRRFAAENIKTFLWGPETLEAQDGDNNYMKACQADPEVRNYFAGCAVHAYAADGVGAGGAGTARWQSVLADSRNTLSDGGLIAQRNSLIPTIGPGGEQNQGNGGVGISTYQTETSQGGLSKEQYESWQNALDVFGAVTSSLRDGNVSGWYYIGLQTQNNLYQSYKHYDKFVFGGARRIPLNPPAGTDGVAFRNPDGTVAIVFANGNGTLKNISIGGLNLPSTYKAYLSIDQIPWKDLGTVSGTSIAMPPNSMLTLWGGANALIAASGVTVSGGNTINSASGKLQYSSTVLPLNLIDKNVNWSVIPTTGNASIDQLGMLTAISNGIVTVRATSVATPTVFGDLVLTISGQYVKLTSMTVDGVGGVRNVAPASTLQMTVSGVAPAQALIRDATWTLNPASGIASINTNGLLTGISSGLVTVIGTSVDNNTVTSRVVVTVTSSSVAVTSATVTGGANIISTSLGTLQMSSTFSPLNATSTTVGWSISGSIASINPTTGLVSALGNGNGVVTVTGTYTSWGISAIRVITISGQASPVTAATIDGVGGVSTISVANGTLQMTVTGFLPTDATNTTPTWSLLAPNFGNSISNGGLLQSATNSNGVITVQAAFGAIIARRVITISNQNIPLTAATINGLGGVNVINTANGTLQMTTTGIAPLGANQNTTPTWSVLAPAFGNTINATTGLLQATTNSNGVITVQAAFGAILVTRTITVSNQIVPVTAATINGLGGVNVINTANGTLQMTTTGLAPLGANQNLVPTWSVLAPAFGNTINATTGLLQATTNSNGVITVQAAFGSVLASRQITVTNQVVPVTAATINGIGGVSAITSNLGTLQLTTTGLAPLGANQNTTPVWSLVSGTAASLNVATGVLTAINNGTVVVQGLFGSVVAQRTITISNQLTGISINASANTITTNNGTIQMQLTYNPVGASVSGVNWATNNANASVNATGLVTGLLNGNVTVTATSIQNNAFTSSFVIAISNQAASLIPVTSVSLTGIQTILNTGSTTITSTVLPANATNSAVNWSLNPVSGIASIGSSNANQAILNGVANGVVTVIGRSISNTSVVGTIVITVSGFAIPVTSTTVNGSGGVSLIAVSGGTLQMLAPYSPLNANSNTTLGWTMIDLTAKNTLNSNGLLTAKDDGNGVVTITGSYGLVTSTRLVTISGQRITATSMTINGSNITAQSGTSQMTVIFNPSNANLGTTVGWTSSNASIANINPTTGLVSAITNGVVTITGTAGALVSIKSITISGQFVGIPVTSTTVNGAGGINQITSSNGSLQMLAPYSPANANQNTLLGWTINDPTGKNSINGTTGVLQANNDGNGLVTITGSYGSIISKRVVTISGQGITATSISVSGSNISTLNGTSQMIATFGPVGANIGTSVTWSSFPVGRVNGSGLVSTNGLNEIVTITGTAGALSSTFTLSISGQVILVSGMTLTGTSNSISSQNGFITMGIPQFNPSNPSNTSITWSVMTTTGEAKVSINSSGILQALNDGNGVVTVVGTANDGSGVVAYYPVTISGQTIGVLSATISGIEGVSNLVNSISFLRGQLVLIANVLPTTAGNSMNWTVSDLSIATISGNGSNQGALKALSGPTGNGVITVTATSISTPSIKAFAVVTITNNIVIPLVSLSVSGSNQITTNGGTLQLVVTRNPINTTDDVTFISSSSTIARVNSNGLVTAFGNGEVTISVNVPNNLALNQTFTITVSGQYAKALTISGIGSSLITAAGGSLSMESTIRPLNVIPEQIIWSITNQFQTNRVYASSDLVSINSVTGLITSNNYGNGTVTVVGFLPNSSLTSTITIQIENQRLPVLQVSLLPIIGITSPGHAVFAKGVALPAIASDKSFIWSAISNSNLVNVNSITGEIISTDLRNGTATIKGQSKSDPNLFSTVTVTISGQSNSIDYELVDENSNIVAPLLGNGLNAFNIYPKLYPLYDNVIYTDVILRESFVTYSFEPAGVINVNSNGLVSLVNENAFENATITGTYRNNPLLKFVIIVNKQLTSVLGKDAFNKSISTFPVPFNNTLKIDGLNPGDKVTVTNVLGVKLASFVADSTFKTIDTQEFISGTYYISIISNGNSQTIKVLK